MFLHVCVCPSVHRNGHGPGGVPGPGGARSRGVCGDPSLGMATAVGGTHPTGILSCFDFFSRPWVP